LLKAAVTQVWYDNKESIQSEYGPFQYGLNHSYAALFDRHGLLPLAVLPTHSATPLEVLAEFDILVLTGGGDPSPSLFGRENQGSRNPRSFRSTFDIKLYRAARELNMPILGICLGMQLMGIAEGVALIQDIPQDEVFHDGSAGNPAEHTITLEPGSRLFSLLGKEISVSSSHHQALEETPPGYTVTARSRDGLIEAIESADRRALGVQWHPERDTTGDRIVESVMKLAGSI
jgi:putative glutamine amidotransferase